VADASCSFDVTGHQRIAGQRVSLEAKLVGIERAVATRYGDQEVTTMTRLTFVLGVAAWAMASGYFGEVRDSHSCCIGSLRQLAYCRLPIGEPFGDFHGRATSFVREQLPDATATCDGN
jgi:hypothetical protein